MTLQKTCKTLEKQQQSQLKPQESWALEGAGSTIDMRKWTGFADTNDHRTSTVRENDICCRNREDKRLRNKMRLQMTLQRNNSEMQQIESPSFLRFFFFFPTSSARKEILSDHDRKSTCNKRVTQLTAWSIFGLIDPLLQKKKISKKSKAEGKLRKIFWEHVSRINGCYRYDNEFKKKKEGKDQKSYRKL